MAQFEERRVLAGHCLCGACRFELRGPSNFTGHCHCDSCRRATASPMTTWIGHPDGHWSWRGARPTEFTSAPGNTRGFCGTCGTPMFYRSESQPGETHFYAALLDDPELAVPTEHFHADERLSWMPIEGGLPEG